MAVIHPEDRIAGLDRAPRDKPHELHPAVGLLVGFGFICAVAAGVHVLFGVI